ncbi:MAG: ABC transporter permease subunit [Pseudomonadota bacterium]
MFSARRLVLFISCLWLACFVLAPMLIVLRLSFSEAADALPPYLPQFMGDVVAFFQAFNLESYNQILSDSLYFESYFNSVVLALTATLLTGLIGYPLALAISRSAKKWQPLLLMLVMVPFWTSFLIRIYAWIGILKDDGFLNAALQSLGLTDAPLTLLNTQAAVLIGMVYAYLPFMVLPIYAALNRLDDALLEAAADLGCPPWQRFWRVTWPLTMPGVIAGAALVFIPSVGEFVIPDLLGGSGTLMIGKTLWVDFFSNRDWPLASAAAIIMLVTILVPFIAVQRFISKEKTA